MKTPPKVGSVGELKFTVEKKHVIDIAGEADAAVLSTPSLIWELEHAAREAIAPILEAGETSVGVRIEVDHLAATPLGQEVTCRANIIHVDGPVISFQLIATDPFDTIARGLHKRRVIRSDRFRAHVKKKSART